MSLVITGDERDAMLYLNVNISNPSSATATIPSSFSQSLNSPLVPDPSQWQICVWTLLVDLSSLFLFQMPPGNAYSVTLQVSGQSFRHAVLLPTNNPSNPTPVRSVTAFIAAVNAAFISAFVLAKASLLASSTEYLINPPQIVYNSATQLCSLVVDQAYWDQNNDIGAQIFFSSQLMQKFSGLQNNFQFFNSPSGQDNVLVITDNGQNHQPNVNPGAFVGTLATALTQNTPVTSLSVSPLTAALVTLQPIQLNAVVGGITINQVAYLSANAAIGATSLSISSITPIASFGVGSAVTQQQPTQVVVTSQWVDVTQWLSLSKLIITSQYLGTRPEFYLANQVPGATSSIAGNTSPVNVIADFLLNGQSTFTSTSTLEFINYNTRWIDMPSAQPSNLLDLTFAAYLNDGTTQALVVFPGCQTAAKFGLRRKPFLPLVKSVSQKRKADQDEKQKQDKRMRV